MNHFDEALDGIVEIQQLTTQPRTMADDAADLATAEAAIEAALTVLKDIRHLPEVPDAIGSLERGLSVLFGQQSETEEEVA